VKQKRIPEVDIQRHEATSFPLTDADQLTIRRRFQVLLMDGGDVMAGMPQERRSSNPEVFVQLQLHARRHQPSST
jgi:hypothetical protein